MKRSNSAAPTVVGRHDVVDPDQLQQVDGRWLAYSIDQLSKATSLGRQRLYDEINAGRLVACKIGRRTLFRREDVDRWLASARAIEPVAVANLSSSVRLPAVPYPAPTDDASPAVRKNRLQLRRRDRIVLAPPGPPWLSLAVRGSVPWNARTKIKNFCVGIAIKVRARATTSMDAGPGGSTIMSSTAAGSEVL